MRAGKTVTNVFAFAMELERTPDKIHLATGSSASNAKLNIAEAGGYGLEYIFRGRSRYGKFKGYDCIYLDTDTGEKIVIFSGTDKANSFKRIRGNSYGMWIATEINLHHENSVKECFNRLEMSKNRKIFWDLNPDTPNHKIYVNYIDHYKKMKEDGKMSSGYTFENFTIFDNINLSDERRKELVEEYDPTTVWYRRDILGQRVAAEGLIYEKFANDSSKYRVKAKDVPKLGKIAIGVDFGGNNSKHTFVATGITPDYKDVYVLASDKVETGIDATQIGLRYVEFLKKVENMYGQTIPYTYADSAEQVINLDMKRCLKEAGLNRKVWNSYKSTILERIRATDSLVYNGRLWFTEHADTVVSALEEALWDSKAAENGEMVRLDNGTTDIDTLDAFEYSFSREINKLMK